MPFTLRHAALVWGGCNVIPVLLVDNTAQYDSMTDEKLDTFGDQTASKVNDRAEG